MSARPPRPEDHPLHKLGRIINSVFAVWMVADGLLMMQLGENRSAAFCFFLAALNLMIAANLHVEFFKWLKGVKE